MSETNQNGIPYWNMNLPPSRHTKECPSYLQYAGNNDKDRTILSTPDSDYQRQSWQNVQQIILNNRLNLFLRVPSDLRRYRQYCERLTKDYGSVMSFVMQERLKWEDLKPKGEPFEHPGTHS
jgi:hypothetical protein